MLSWLELFQELLISQELYTVVRAITLPVFLKRFFVTYQEALVKDELKFQMVPKEDKFGQDYYVFTTDLPMNFDFSKIALLVHPWEDDDGKFGAQLTIRRNKYEYVPEPPKSSTDSSQDDR